MLSSSSITEPVPSGAFVMWPDAFTARELDRIERHGDSLALQKADLSDRRRDYAAIRITQVAWMERTPESAWLYERLEKIVLELNSRFFQYELFGLSESLQYTVYHGGEGAHFDWHKDYGVANEEPRKISISLQLSDESVYEGCELELHTGAGAQTAPRKRGTLIAFPSYALHRVTPIRSGTRKSLVIWAAGPEFR